MLQLKVQEVALCASVTIARHIRGWYARRKVAKQRQISEAFTQRCHISTFRTLRKSFDGWKFCALRAVRWKHLCTAAGRRSPPTGEFWKLKPTYGKTAVAQALRNW